MLRAVQDGLAQEKKVVPRFSYDDVRLEDLAGGRCRNRDPIRRAFHEYSGEGCGRLRFQIHDGHDGGFTLFNPSWIHAS